MKLPAGILNVMKLDLLTWPLNIASLGALQLSLRKANLRSPNVDTMKGGRWQCSLLYCSEIHRGMGRLLNLIDKSEVDTFNIGFKIFPW